MLVIEDKWECVMNLKYELTKVNETYFKDLFHNQ